MYIDHIAIWTIDLEKEKDFFLRYFDCRVNEKYINSEKKFASYFITFSGGARIELMSRPDIEKRSWNDGAGLVHLAIDAGERRSVDELTDRLESDGHTVVSKPRVTGDGYYESVILDPEGNRIEILSLQ
jgi:lactoylglutathione lyase